ncbi:TetR/AcrR family transcriptional regulator [Mycobacterium persicum]|uniref:HTH-type transcriptional regulator TtgR n=1 Tax=Mycobacterium persicum TaxID=1487726 RepID=A0A1X0L6X1_9MYCO|nr:TetR/AcrR family transcriptional regulator [Mycobacterium persicum]KZS80183.1 TetR family transcriptional regulator [Mycobacterium persicum]ORB54441.1 TetR family transcriptional regulator [Mycobacterium persicum]ORB89006.1 TetR family transcriptional regulator [Mycobacterium persicum]ORB94375.1 TetR family transcriptional regulator [Mycobacterium persicum]ORC01060.1 TetR family transcriptional regulator [Mycobacterium persicum]
MTTQPATTDTRDLIIESAYACFRKHGLQKATIVDIARLANVSRSTVYEYFPDKAAIVEACAEHASEQFYRQMARAMSRVSSLEEKLCCAAVFVTRARREIVSATYVDADAITLLLTKDAAVLLRESVDFFAPYLAAAKLTGEVRKDLDVEAAGEWFARILFSLFTTPSPVRDLDDADALEAVADLVRAHVVRGFRGDRPRSARAASKLR